jgi:hypothetical protein
LSSGGKQVASLFVIRERSTGAFCTSSKYQSFSHDLNSAALFARAKNAEKAIRGMFHPDTEGHCGMQWTVEETNYYHGDKENLVAIIEASPRGPNVEYVEYIRKNVENKLADLEVVEVKLSLV